MKDSQIKILIPLVSSFFVLCFFSAMMHRDYFAQRIIVEQHSDSNADCAIKIENVSYQKHTVSFDVVVPESSTGIFVFPNLRYDYLKKKEYESDHGRGSSLHVSPSVLGEYLPYRVAKGKIYICAYYPEISNDVETNFTPDEEAVKLHAGERITRHIYIYKKSTLLYDYDRYTDKTACLFGINEIIIQIGYLNSPSFFIPQESSWEKSVSWKRYRYILKNQKICEKHFCVK